MVYNVLSAKLNLLVLLGFLFCSTCLSAQSGQGSRVTVTVVPWASDLSEIKPLLDNSFDYAAAVNEVTRAFDLRGYSTVDFVARYRAANLSSIVAMDQWRTAFVQLVENLPADMIVQIRMDVVRTTYGERLNAFLDVVDQNSQIAIMSSGVLESQPRTTRNYASMIKYIIRDQNIGFQEFMAELGRKFNDIRSQGSAVQLSFGIDANCPYDLETMVGDEGYLLGEIIAEWVTEKSQEWYQAGLIADVSYRQSMSDASALKYDNVRVPFTRPDGNRYDTENFATEIRRAVSLMGKDSEKGSLFKVSKKVNRNQIFITIMQ